MRNVQDILYTQCNCKFPVAIFDITHSKLNHKQKTSVIIPLLEKMRIKETDMKQLIFLIAKRTDGTEKMRH